MSMGDGPDYGAYIQGIDFNNPQYSYPYYGSQTETTEVTEEEFDGDGKLVSRKVTKTTRTYPKNGYDWYPITVQY
jgi:hypothetical protein